MTAESTHRPGAARLERTYGAPPELIWELWTTAAGLDQWFAPDGFESRVTELELRPGGRLRYTHDRHRARTGRVHGGHRQSALD